MQGYQTPQAKAFQTYLRMKFKDLKGAKKWLLEWYGMGQQFHKGKYKGRIMSMRCMAAHISLALHDQSDVKIESCFDTKYGPELNEYWQDNI